MKLQLILLNDLFYRGTGPAGTTVPSSTDGFFFTAFNETTKTSRLTFDTPWFIPNESIYFRQVSDSEVMLQEGVYEISVSGLIEQADDTHGAEIYLQNEEGSAIKDLTFKLPENTDKRMYFTKSIIFRFENPTTLSMETNILGNPDTSNVTITEITLYIKKIHE